MKMKFLFKQMICILILSSVFKLDAQTWRPFRKYMTQSYSMQLFLDYPQARQNKFSFENSARYSKPNSEPYHLPLVFHILVSQGMHVPTDAEIKNQINDLNKAFGKYNNSQNDYPNNEVENYFKNGKSLDIQFVVSNAMLVAGRNTIKQTIKTTFENYKDVFQNKSGGDDIYKPKEFINIYICKLPSQQAGYAFGPWAPAEFDGIVINVDFFGKGIYKEYDKGMTLVHLMGNYLGINDIWNETIPCTDDGVEDTPIHTKPNNSIITEKNHRYVNACMPIHDTEMYMNYMDNTDDKYLSLFTQGQLQRARYTLSHTEIRNNLVNSGESEIVNLETRNSDRNQQKFSISPNPASDFVRLNFNSENNESIKIELYNVLGTAISSTKIKKPAGFFVHRISINSIKDKIIFIKATYEDHQTFTHKLLLNN